MFIILMRNRVRMVFKGVILKTLNSWNVQFWQIKGQDLPENMNLASRLVYSDSGAKTQTV